MIGLHDFHSGEPAWVQTLVDYIERRLLAEGPFEAELSDIQDELELPDGFYQVYLDSRREDPPNISPRTTHLWSDASPKTVHFSRLF